MATSNFGYDNVLGIIALNTIDYEKNEVECYNTYEAVSNEDKIERIDEWQWQVYYDDWKEELEILNNNLSYIKLELESGYYEGAMLKLESTGKAYLSTDELQCIIENRNDKEELTKVCRDIDCYYYGVKPSKIFNEYRIVVDWINERIKNEELLNLGIAYRFSNGETGYSRSKELLQA